MFAYFWQVIVIIILLSILAGPAGCMVLWQRLSFYTDSLAHAAILGVVLSLYFQVPTSFGVMIIAGILALMLTTGSNQKPQLRQLHTNLYGQFLLSLALVLHSFIGGNVDIESYLFGEVLLATTRDVYILSALVVMMMGWLKWRWRDICLISLSPEMASVHGVKVNTVMRVNLLLLSLIVAAAIKITGIILLAAMLILPASIARIIAKSPWQMAVIAMLVAIIGAGCGFGLSYYGDVPTSATMVSVYGFVFLLANLSIKS